MRALTAALGSFFFGYVLGEINEAQYVIDVNLNVKLD